MLSPFAALVAATQLVSSSLVPMVPEAPDGEPAAPEVMMLVIARPEASDLYLPVKTRTTAQAMLEHNPQLLRADHDESPYQVSALQTVGQEVLRPVTRRMLGAQHAPLRLLFPVAGLALVLLVPFLLILARYHHAPRTTSRFASVRLSRGDS